MGKKTILAIIIPLLLTGIAIGLFFALRLQNENASLTPTVTVSPSPLPTETRTYGGNTNILVSNVNPTSSLRFPVSFTNNPILNVLDIPFQSEQGITLIQSELDTVKLTANLSLSSWPLPLGYRTGPTVSSSSSWCSGLKDSNNNVWIAYVNGVLSSTVRVVRSDLAYASNNQYSVFTNTLTGTSLIRSAYMWEDDNDVYYVSCFGDNGNVIGSYGAKTGTELNNSMTGFSPASGTSDNFGVHIGVIEDDPQYVMIGHTHERQASTQISTNGGKSWSAEIPVATFTTTIACSPALVRRTEGFVAIPRQSTGLYISLWDGTNFSTNYQITNTTDCRQLSAAYIGGLPTVVFQSSATQLSYIQATQTQPGSSDWSSVVPISTVSFNTTAIRLTTCNGFPFVFYSDADNLTYAINSQTDGFGIWNTGTLGTSSGIQQANAIVQPNGVLITLCDGSSVNWNWIPRTIALEYQVTGSVQIST